MMLTMKPLFVRPLSTDERNCLKAGLRSSSAAFPLRRCQVLLKSADGANPTEIAGSLAVPHKLCATSFANSKPKDS
jgi:hypothetical protein